MYTGSDGMERCCYMFYPPPEVGWLHRCSIRENSQFLRKTFAAKNFHYAMP